MYTFRDNVLLITAILAVALAYAMYHVVRFMLEVLIFTLRPFIKEKKEQRELI